VCYFVTHSIQQIFCEDEEGFLTASLYIYQYVISVQGVTHAIYHNFFRYTGKGGWYQIGLEWDRQKTLAKLYKVYLQNVTM